MADTVLVKGAGGAMWVLDIPPAGTMARERHDGSLAKGDFAILPVDVPAEGTSARAKFDAQLTEGSLKLELNVVAVAEPAPGEPPADPGEEEAPAGNASRPAWAAYAATLGVPVDEGMSRDDIRAAVTTVLASAPGEPPADPGEEEAPAGNASRPAWAAYAATLGVPVDEGMSRDDIRAAVTTVLASAPGEPPADPGED